jgi:hypothetical protein
MALELPKAAVRDTAFEKGPAATAVETEHEDYSGIPLRTVRQA